MWTLRTSQGRPILLASLPATLGSGDEADVVIAHPSVDVLHAAVSSAREGGLQIAAIGDAALAIGGQTTHAGHLVAGDELLLGEVRLVVEYRHDEAGIVAEPPPSSSGGAAGHASPPGTGAPMPPGGTTGRPPPPRREQAGREQAGRDRHLRVRDRRLQYSRVETRKGLLHVDLEQLPPALRAVFVLGVLLVCAGLVYAVASLIDALA